MTRATATPRTIVWSSLLRSCRRRSSSSLPPTCFTSGSWARPTFQVDRMEKFYYDCGLDERATMYNNHLVGKDVDKVWKEENLVRLLPFPNGDKIIAFLRAVRELTEPQVASPPPSLSTLQRMWPTSRGSWQRPERGSLPH